MIWCNGIPLHSYKSNDPYRFAFWMASSIFSDLRQPNRACACVWLFLSFIKGLQPTKSDTYTTGRDCSSAAYVSLSDVCASVIFERSFCMIAISFSGQSGALIIASNRAWSFISTVYFWAFSCMRCDCFALIAVISNRKRLGFCFLVPDIEHLVIIIIIQIEYRLFLKMQRSIGNKR